MVWQISTADRKPKHSSPPTCLDKWEFIIPNFLRSMTALNTTKDKWKRNCKNSVSTTTKMKALVKNLQVKLGSLVSKCSLMVYNMSSIPNLKSEL